MQMCTYEEKYVYSFDILGINNIINFDIEKGFRSASKKGLLKCSDCGNPVIFRFNDLEKRIPHFAHLNKGNTESCGYGKETEEHIEGKRILLNRMRELYPNIYNQMRYKVKSINRYADLFFQLDDQQLIIEFQRTDLDFQLFEEKSKNYDSINMNNLWLLSGNKEVLKDITREHRLSFFERIHLNIANKPILFLDVENRTITMMAKIVYEDKETKEITMDRIFYKTYPVDNLIIKLDGTIESNFEESYKIERLKFIKEHQEKLELEKKLRMEKSYELERLNLEKKTSINNKIDSTRNIEGYKKKYKSEIKPELRGIHYKVYKIHVDNLLNNYTEDLFEMISLVCNNNITINQIVKELLDAKINEGNMEAKDILNKITEFIKVL